MHILKYFQSRNKEDTNINKIFAYKIGRYNSGKTRIFFKYLYLYWYTYRKQHIFILKSRS